MKRFAKAKSSSNLSRFAHATIQAAVTGITRYWEIIALVYFTICLLDYHFYRNAAVKARFQTNPWAWPTYNVPPKDKTEPNNRNGVGPKQFQQPKKENLVENLSNPKVILFDHPAFGEEIFYAVNRSVCGNCEITYDSKLYQKADAVVFHFAGTRWVPKRR